MCRGWKLRPGSEPDGSGDSSTAQSRHGQLGAPRLAHFYILPTVRWTCAWVAGVIFLRDGHWSELFYTMLGMLLFRKRRYHDEVSCLGQRFGSWGLSVSLGWVDWWNDYSDSSCGILHGACTSLSISCLPLSLVPCCMAACPVSIFRHLLLQ
jgi:hypothetical protein